MLEELLGTADAHSVGEVRGAAGENGLPGASSLAKAAEFRLLE
jgi:hypothetical protein